MNEKKKTNFVYSDKEKVHICYKVNIKRLYVNEGRFTRK